MFSHVQYSRIQHSELHVTNTITMFSNAMQMNSDYRFQVFRQSNVLTTLTISIALSIR